MKVLVVYAHPNPESFNHAVVEEFVSGLAEGGHTSEVIDLYGINFDPRLNAEDLVQFQGGELPQEVRDQQAKVAGAEALVFVHPMWGWTIPAMLKGWLDRVFSMGFAYSMSDKGMEGLLKHSKVLVISTAGETEDYYQSEGYTDAFRKINDGFFKEAGIQNVQYKCLYGIQAAGDEGRKKYLEEAHQLGKEF